MAVITVTLMGCGNSDLLEPGESAVIFLDAEDWSTARTAWEHSPLTETDLQDALDAAGDISGGSYDLETTGLVWDSVGIDNPGSVNVRGESSPGAGDRNFIMVCWLVPAEGATQVEIVLGDDDEDPVACGTTCSCNPALTLDGAGEWVCAFSVSPFTTACYDLEPLGGEVTVFVE